MSEVWAVRAELLRWGRQRGGELEELAYEIANQLAAADYDKDNHAARERLVKNVALLEDLVQEGE